MKTILITGATGFIGSYFINKYNNKYDIKTFSFLMDDFNSLSLKNVDVVLHLSALVHQMSGAKKEEYYEVNVNQTLKLADKAKRDGVKQFVFMSTVKVYGEENDTPYTENTPCNPSDYYGESKLKAERELMKFNVNDYFKLSIIRTPVVYGCGVKGNIRSLIKLIDMVPILPFKDINNKRSMVYIGNLCNLINEVIEQKREGVFLANDDLPLSTTKLVELIAENLEKNIYLIKPFFFDRILKLLKPEFYKRLFESLEVDNSITKRKLNLQNPYSVEDGIRYMIKGEK